MILDIIKSYFESHDYTVLTAENGRDGLDLFKKHNPDIALIDLNMPIMNGFEVLTRLKNDSPDTPTIVISGEGEMADVIQALHSGAWHYLTKPIETYDIIKHAVEQALGKALLIQQNKAYQKGLETKLSTALEHFPGFVYTCDKDFKITYTNKKLSQYLKTDMAGQPCHQAIFGSETTCSWCPAQTDTSLETVRQEIEHPTNGCWYDMIIQPILDQQNNIIEYQVVLIDITAQKQQLKEAEEREAILLEEKNRLTASLADRYRFGKILGKSKPMQEVYQIIIDAAGSNASVIVYGESGTGKELVAQEIHNNSPRADKPFISVNCGAIPENLIESEFFGYNKGAFSGAEKNKQGYLDVADGGTLFLDEVGEIPLNLQIKLLRAIDGGGFTPLGGNEIKKPDVRIISATNRNLTQLVKEGQMRQDFLYRIHVIPVYVPKLSQRKEDINLLIDHFLDVYQTGKNIELSAKTRRALADHSWVGNVRELQNTIQRFVTLGRIDLLELDQGDQKIEIPNNEPHSLPEIMEALEKQILLSRFEKHNWHQSNTAASLQIDRKTLYRKMKQHQINKPK